MTAWMRTLLQDLHYALRTFRRNPRFTLAVTLTLGLGVGANTAIFSVIDSALFRPLPLPNAGELVALYNFNRKTSAYLSSSYPDYQDLRARARSLRDLAAYVRLPLNLATGTHTERIPVEAVTPNYFATLELGPRLGRTFRDEDRGALVAMVSEDFWRTRMGGDANVTSHTVTIENRRFAIVGVVPARYRGTNLNWSDTPRVWIPLESLPQTLPRFAQIDILHHREMRWLLMLGRRQPGASLETARAELETLAGSLAQTEPDTNRDITVFTYSANRSKFWPAYRESIEQSLAVFAAAAALVLLLACANVANLLLERGLARRREIAIRLSLGAGRARLLRQLLTENLLLAMPGLLAALAVAYGLEDALLRFPNMLGLPLALESRIDGRVLLFAAVVSLAAAAVCGLAPALAAARASIAPTLKEAGSALSGSGARRLRGGLVMVQVALSTILLVGGGIFGHSLMKAYSTDLGFHPDHLIRMSFDPPRDRTVDWQRALRQLAEVPGVQSASAAANAPLAMVKSTVPVANPANPQETWATVEYNTVSADYFCALGVDLAAGRGFDSAGSAGGVKSVVVNQAAAEHWWPTSNPVGRTLRVHFRVGETTVLVAGVARNAKYHSVWEAPQPYLYFNAAQWNEPVRELMVRTRLDPLAVLPAVRRAWDSAVPGVPLYDVRTGEEQLNYALAPQRIAAGLLAAFGLLATLLASIGLYSVIAYSVSERRREIGIRMAVGATPNVVVGHIFRRAMVLTSAGLIAGAAAAAALMRLAASLVKGVSAFDPPAVAVAIAIVAVVSAMAALVPARRAARIDPLVALKWE